MRLRSLINTFLFYLVVTSTVMAQSGLSSSRLILEVNTNGTPGVHQLTLPHEVLSEARDDLGDLRLYDSDNKEIPYAIRIRQAANSEKDFTATIFNRATVGNASEVTIDLGQEKVEHNEVEIQTSGENFRRLATVEGSDTGGDWRSLTSDGVIFSFRSDGKSVVSSRVGYPVSRYRYLRIRVNSDDVVDKTIPMIGEVKARLVVREKDLLSSWHVEVPSYQLLRNQGAHATVWTIDFGRRVPVSRLILAIDGESFYRPFLVETADDPQKPQLVADGYISRRSGETATDTVITFDEEVHARKLRLQVTDYSNPILNITSIQAAAAARELVFELKSSAQYPLRLYFADPNQTEPHYDFEKELDAKLKNTPNVAWYGGLTTNPAYTPPLLPFTERLSWLIYLVLIGSTLALGWILSSLARTIMRSDSEPISNT